PRAIPAFPTRRSSDLILQSKGINALCGGESPGSLRGNLSLSAQCTTADIADVGIAGQQMTITGFVGRNFSLSTTSTSASQSRLGDRKSTRLNSSHVKI